MRTVSGLKAGGALSEALRLVAQSFRGAGIESPEVDARALFCHALRLERAQLIAQNDRILKPREIDVISTLAARRLRHEPVSRILGKKEFWSVSIAVTPDVLVPRPETETVVEAALDIVVRGGLRMQKLRILDIGTGSGALLLSVDGTFPDVPASEAAIAAYGQPPTVTSTGQAGGYPQLRLVTLIGCGTRGLTDAVFGPRKTSEQELTARIAGRGTLGPGMLVIADRNFCGYPVISALAATGADLLIRAKAGMVLPVLQALHDGSARTILPDPAASRARHNRNSLRRARGSALGPDTRPLRGFRVPPSFRTADPYRIFTGKDGIKCQGNTGSSLLSSVMRQPGWS